MFSRRDFIRNASITASLAATGQLPLWAADENGECYATQGFAKFLETYKPPSASAGARDITYTLVNMGMEYGRLTTARAGAGTYVCDYAIEPGSMCKAKFQVRGDLLSGVSSWSLTSRTDPVSEDMADLAVYAETGEVSNGKAVVKAGGKTSSEFTTAVPLLPDWLLPLAAPMLPTKPGNYIFSLLREGTYFLGAQRLLYDGTAKITVKGGKTLELTNYLHLGEGTLPTNYLIDKNGVTVIVTHGFTAEALR